MENDTAIKSTENWSHASPALQRCCWDGQTAFWRTSGV